MSSLLRQPGQAAIRAAGGGESCLLGSIPRHSGGLPAERGRPPARFRSRVLLPDGPGAGAPALVRGHTARDPGTSAWLVRPDGQFYTQYSPGLPLVLAPLVVVGRALAGPFETLRPAYRWINEGRADLASRVVVSYFNVPITAASAALMSRLALQTGLPAARRDRHRPELRTRHLCLATQPNGFRRAVARVAGSDQRAAGMAKLPAAATPGWNGPGLRGSGQAH